MHHPPMRAEGPAPLASREPSVAPWPCRSNGPWDPWPCGGTSLSLSLHPSPSPPSPPPPQCDAGGAHATRCNVTDCSAWVVGSDVFTYGGTSPLTASCRACACTDPVASAPIRRLHGPLTCTIGLIPASSLAAAPAVPPPGRRPSRGTALVGVGIVGTAPSAPAAVVCLVMCCTCKHSLLSL